MDVGPPGSVLLPTPHPEVNAILQEVRAGARSILADQMVGMYLYGSLATGDFDPSSDVDFLVVTKAGLAIDRFHALRAMHTRIGSVPSHWALELEGSYIPRRALRRHDTSHSIHPHIDRGTADLFWMHHDEDWIFQRHLLVQHGVVVEGPPPSTLIDAVTTDELRHAASSGLRTWWAPMIENPAPLHRPAYSSYAVLTLCRILYTLEHGTVASKSAAALWSQQTLGEPWASVIERALKVRKEPAAGTETSDIATALDFIRLAIERDRLSSDPRNMDPV